MAEQIAAGESSDWTMGTVKSIEHEGGRVAVFRTERGYFALEDRCTHAEVRLSDGWVEHNCVACPWHGAEFDLESGAALSRPAVLPVRTFRVWEEDGTIWVEV